MIDIRVNAASAGAPVLALPVRPGNGDGNEAELVPTTADPPAELLDEITRFLSDVEHRGAAGNIHVLPRPGRTPNQVLLVGVGTGDSAAWRSAGAAVARVARTRFAAVTMHLPEPATTPGETAEQARCFAEGAWLAAYRFRLAPDTGEHAPKLHRITLVTAESVAVMTVAQSRAITDAVILARDLTNTPSLQKSPQWFADRVANAAARRPGVRVTVLEAADLVEKGFGGILAVGSGSARPPCLLEMSYRPRRPRAHVVLVGKGITFDSGGISIKPVAGMKLMRKDMGGAAAVCAALLGAADLDLPVRLTVLAPLAENMISGSAVRPGDVVRHFGGLTTEIQNTDAEGRVVLGDALAYAARRFRPDLLVDVATLTGAAYIALGRRTAALFTENDELAAALTAAGDAVGERMWRMPLANDYTPLLASDIADVTNSPGQSQASAITAALYLREFTGKLRPRWAHVDMSAPSWADTNDGLLVKGATGWGVRMLLRWFATL